MATAPKKPATPKTTKASQPAKTPPQEDEPFISPSIKRAMAGEQVTWGEPPSEG